jgi:hypothetical protein
MRELRYLCEDELSESILRRLLSEQAPQLQAIPWISRGGKGFVRQKFSQASNASRNGVAVLVLVDLDTSPCASALLVDWLGKSFNVKNSNLLFRAAVREVEAWLLADAIGISKLLQIPKGKVPGDVEKLDSAKETLVNLARTSRSGVIRRGLVPVSKSNLPIGPAYNDILTDFVARKWRFDSAAEGAPSLQRFLGRLKEFAKKQSGR